MPRPTPSTSTVAVSSVRGVTVTPSSEMAGRCRGLDSTPPGAECLCSRMELYAARAQFLQSRCVERVMSGGRLPVDCCCSVDRGYAEACGGVYVYYLCSWCVVLLFARWVVVLLL